MDDAYKDELAIVTYVMHEIIVVALTFDCPIILLKSPTIPENFALIKAQCDGLHLSYHPKNRVENYTRVHVGHEQHDLYDSYILDVVHDTTENYFERGKFGCRNFHITKTPLFMLKVLKMFLFHLPMLVLFAYLIYFLIRFLCIGSGLGLNLFHIFFLMLSFASNPYFDESNFYDLHA